jgi:hypothetical protein
LIRFDVKLRNTTGRVIEGHYSTMDAFYQPPEMLGAAGKPVKVSQPTVEFSGIWAPIPYRLAPGEEKAAGQVVLAFEPAGPTPDAGAKEFRVHCVAHAEPVEVEVR